MKTNSMQLFAGLFFILSLSYGSCSTKGTSGTDPLLLKCWTHGFEEDTQDGNLNFRPCATHTFPAARYRHTFTLKENGEVEYSVLAPNDAHTTEQGKWSYDSKTKKLRITNKDNVVVHEYEVVELNEDLLKVKE